MPKNNTLSTAIIIFSVSLLISSWVLSDAISYGLSCNRNIAVDDITLSQEENQHNESLLMDDTEAAEYLGISRDDFSKMVEQDINDKKTKKVSDPYYYIPYIEIAYSKYYSKKELDKWIEHRMFLN